MTEKYKGFRCSPPVHRLSMWCAPLTVVLHSDRRAFSHDFATVVACLLPWSGPTTRRLLFSKPWDQGEGPRHPCQLSFHVRRSMTADAGVAIRAAQPNKTAANCTPNKSEALLLRSRLPGRQHGGACARAGVCPNHLRGFCCSGQRRPDSGKSWSLELSDSVPAMGRRVIGRYV